MMLLRLEWNRRSGFARYGGVFQQRRLDTVTLTLEAASAAIMTFGLVLVALLLACSTRVTAGLGAVAEDALALLCVVG